MHLLLNHFFTQAILPHAATKKRDFKSGNHFCHKWKSSVSFAVHSLLHLSSTVRFRLQSRRRRLASLSFAACGSSPSAWLFHLCRLRRLVRLRRMLPPVTRTFSALAACDTRTPPHPGGVPPLESGQCFEWKVVVCGKSAGKKKL